VTTRRAFIGALAGALLATPLAADAQSQAPTPRIGMLSSFSPADAAPWYRAFLQGLRDLGWIEGTNVSLTYRYAEGHTDRLPGLVAELVQLKVDLIVTSVTPDTLAAKNATRTIPIVMAAAGDPVATGIVESLARPGGNITGLAQMVLQLAAKRLELLKEMAPKLSRVGVIWNPDDVVAAQMWKDIQLPARQLGLQLYSLEVRSLPDFDKAFERATSARVGALVISPAPLFVTNEQRIADFALKGRLPSIFHLKGFVERGGLAAYGPDRADMFRRAATYVDQILKGAKPASLPVQQPTKFQLVINLKTAKALGLTIPPSLLQRADEVIQ
jgi:putative ABC transport system substrate-binding protein